jgi:FtsP/CotA-like multicopper oxidase with cupredoxin domain
VKAQGPIDGYHGEGCDMSTRNTTGHSVADEFDREITGLPETSTTGTVELADGGEWELTAAPVRKRIGGDEVRMLAYNGSVPGPTVRVRQGSTVSVRFTNRGDHENTVHWHGLRLDNRFDGTHQTQAPVPVGESFTYRVTFPDAGLYWYHPHIREDYGQEMGLYGTVLVEPAEPGYWSPVNRELVITLDDVLIEDGKIAPFSLSTTNYAAMGRFGNVLLINGETHPDLTAQRGEVVRFYLVNTANTRVFNVGIEGARMKRVGGDSGRVEREEFVETVILAPSERVVVEVLFDRDGQVALSHRTPDRAYPLATVTVSDEVADPSFVEAFETLRVDEELAALRDELTPYLDAAPDKTLAFVAEMNLGEPEADGPVLYTCPMHPEITQEEPGRCPICGMKLIAMAAPEPTTYTCPMHPEVVSNEAGHCPKCGMKLVPSDLVAASSNPHGHHAMPEPHDHHGQPDAHTMPEHHGHHGTMSHGGHEAEEHGHHADAAADGIEWEDDMVAVNRITTADNTRWMLVDRETGARNHAIDWHFRVGDRVKIRLLNEMDSDHPMHHPFHIHGAGRFLVLARDGVTASNLVWKDTVLVRTGETVDILLEVTNPGVWMAHCHIAEHHESGMMLSFIVTE